MTRQRFFARAVAFWICLLLASSPAVQAQISAAYEEPDLTASVFDLNALGLDAPVRSRLASVLAAGLTYYNATLDAKILGVALRLDPTNRDALVAAEHRRRNELPDARASATTYPTATVVAYLVGQSGGLRAKGGADSGALAGCLSEIAAELDPDNAAAKYEKSACVRIGLTPAWTFLKRRPAPGSEALPLLKRQTKIRGLTITDLPNGQRTGKLMEVILTAEDARSRQEMGVFTARPVGESMHASLDEAWRAVKLRHPGTGLGQKLVLSFGDIYTLKDGPSAGAAFTLALFALYDPLRLAEDAAMTGAITVDGRVRPVGGVPWKIHAAQAAGCRLVAIPKENASAVDDLPFIYPVSTTWQIQIIAVDTLDEALAVMREDRPANVRAALDLFAAVQRRMGVGQERPGAAHLDLVPTLREVVRLCPGHVSAAAMLKMLAGRSVGTLSLYTSLDELRRLSDAITTELHERLPAASNAVAPLLADATSLDTLRPRLDYRTVDLCNSRAALLRALAAFRARTPGADAAALYNEVRRCAQASEEVEQRMIADPALAEALRH